jgi:hypothetical protein
MINQPYKTSIKFDKEQFQCTSWQLLKIIKSVYGYSDFKAHEWICGDVELVSSYRELFNQPYFKIHSQQEWSGILKDDFQFMWGVFVLLPPTNKDLVPTKWFLTEDIEWLHIPESIIEIRAFDTSYFEIYSIDKGLIDHLSKIN